MNKLWFLVSVLLVFAPGLCWSAQDMGHHHSSAQLTVDQDHAHYAEFAPIGVMGDHVHEAGQWMFSYRYMHMEMGGNRDGTDRLSDSEVLRKFMVAPTDMTMDMHMFGVMYAPSNHLTLMAMFPYIVKSMDHVTRAGARFTTDSSGLGDISLTGLIPVLQWGPHRLHLNAGISLPTGSIDQKGDTPAGRDQQLPYPMQLGSGTIDLLPGITYLGQLAKWSWGAQVKGTVRLGENTNNYSLGNGFEATGWLARKWLDALSGSVRLDLKSWGDINDADPRLNPAVVPTADPDLRAGTELDLLFGYSAEGKQGLLNGHRLALEIGTPLYQNLDGPQLETDWLLTAGWHYYF